MTPLFPAIEGACEVSGTLATGPMALTIGAEQAVDPSVGVSVTPDPGEDSYTLIAKDPRTVFLGGLFFLACLAAMYVASEIVLPVVLAIVLKLLLQPVVRACERLHVPRILGALLATLILLTAFAVLGYLVSGPAASWAAKLPRALPRLKEQLHLLAMPIDAAEQALTQLQGGAAATSPAPSGSAVYAPTLVDTLFTGTKALAAGFFTMLVVLVYLLVSGETFLRRFVEILPRFKDKRRAVEISMHIERDVSAYLMTITVINAVVGVATAGVMFLCGVESPLLWGVTAFLLNYVPILGWIAGVCLFTLLGVTDLGVAWQGFVPAGLYFLIHIVEGETITSWLLSRRFTINPVAVILGLVFWYWMWGVPGAVLAVPMLAITKIICDDTPSLRAFGHFLES